MTAPIWDYLLVVTIGMVLMWFALLFAIFRRLKRAHPAKYAEMGEPSLILNSSLRNQLATFRFLGSREHRLMNDARLSRLADFALIWFFATGLTMFTFMVGAQQ